MVHGIVDLTATGTTLRENGLVIREEIAASTARLIANPVSYRIKAAEIDAVVERCVRLEVTVATAAAVAAQVRALVPPGRSVAAEVAAIVEDVRVRGDAALDEYEQRFAGAPHARLQPSVALDDDVREGLLVAIENVRAVARGGARRRLRRPAARGPDGHAARHPGAARGGLRARRAASLPVFGGHGRDHRAGGGRRRGLRGLRGPSDAA